MFLLLADVFEKFINTCLDYYEITPVIILVVLDYIGMQCLKNGNRTRTYLRH